MRTNKPVTLDAYNKRILHHPVTDALEEGEQAMCFTCLGSRVIDSPVIDTTCPTCGGHGKLWVSTRGNLHMQVFSHNKVAFYHGDDGVAESQVAEPSTTPLLSNRLAPPEEVLLFTAHMGEAGIVLRFKTPGIS